MNSVAFVIITKGDSPYLESMLASLQEYDRIILVDNSIDEKCRWLIGKYRFIYYHESKIGVSCARNAGAVLAKDANYIYFLDDDLTFCEGWSKELNQILRSEKQYDLVGGRVIADYPDTLSIPVKYLYLVGEKNLGDKEKVIRKNYVGGCNLLVRSELFFRIGQFDTHFGHKGSTIGLNEDVVFQEQIRKTGGCVYYNPKLAFIHHWSGTYEDVLERLKLQGAYDKKTDLRTSVFRFVLRYLKYVFCIAIHEFTPQTIKMSSARDWDYLRFKAYISKS